MFFFYNWWSYIIIIPGLIFAAIAQLLVTQRFSKYDNYRSQSGYTASELSERLLRNNSCAVGVTRTSGRLTDHYNPSTKMLALSESTYNNTSIAALGVAAHEVGHACQDEDNYFPLKLRSVLVPVVNLGSRIAIPIVILGIIIEFLAEVSGGIGGYLISIGIVCYSLSTIFCLITLPVEINASRRALKMLTDSGALTREELKGAKKVLSAAALTYVASLLVSLLYLLRFLLIVSRFRRRD